MPQFSVIVPAYDVSGHLALALESVLAQPVRDIEVLVVCDVPGSSSAHVADRFRHRDDRVRILWSPPEAGLGGARNTGIRAATGRYLLFLDGDDTYVPHAFTALERRLAATEHVDVLVFGHERTHWWDGEQGNPLEDLLRRLPAGVFTPDEAPALTGVRLPAWSAAWRRAYVEEHRLAFSEKHFTDIPWGVAAVGEAGRIAALRGVFLHHLLRRQGSRLQGPGPHHLELLDQAEAVFAYAAERGLPARRAHRVFEELTGEMFRPAARTRLLPARDRRAYFRRASALYRRHRPEGFTPPGGSLGVQHRLLAAGSYLAFASLRDANRAAGKASSLPQAARARLPKRSIPRVYARHLKRPVDPNLAVYCSYWGRGYLCNPAAIHAAAARLAPHIRSVFLVTEEAVDSLPAGVEHAVIGTERYWEVVARAKYLINNANFPGAVVKRPGTVHLSTQHGTPVKKMGAEQAQHPVTVAGSGDTAALLRRTDRFDYMLSSNRHSTEVWQREYPCAYETLEYGYPRNDVYYSATADDVRRIRKELGIPQGKTALLYAPTHRDYATGYDARLDLAAFCEAVGEDFVVLLRAHYFYDEGQSKTLRGQVIDVTHHLSSEEVCLAADALITDYSSISFDYAHLDRPIVIYADDWDVYRDLRGVTFDLLADAPGPVARTEEELTEIFRSGAYADARSAERRAAFRERFCAFDDGLAAERVVRRVLLGEGPESLPPSVPLTERTPAPAAIPLARS
ncbi:bifunctional glycosyltransferase/CDP-glycerol:glycerophosphate glycerophosphotransferase [Streptomyces indicus]|uniref:CDP-glycerol glycerophosphotransferase, TagB/SpsB family n=1 Tax=Streptomyces indicus TaxID=417292 RepID=A0A1G9FFH1_9ACTN|nr:bifunctional glycosyltransferase family 2 protein/CDP-glycerol:glycerophosphate glycerophosphotransferase [Streptomyces indicus]SDK87124.1 CDP-glycerol glycerophosphotransferase, TagB/SpsB family [Streptomyces indicus]